MITREEIQTMADDIVREFEPLQVILFGSYAYGAPTADSDVDLLVVMDIPTPHFISVKCLASCVHRSIKRKFQFGVFCFDFNL
ncbi:nucleotidyltransferase domain-containing protein [Candidatus Poribacteria bacterium]|nr:nucleotidyltransferase domain-containing protein [Candidatus Poribacteria bacterium]MYK17152.1 nucleotidyltransferase domain-containing protein [Candidatus Poribacteria bacterium]